MSKTFQNSFSLQLLCVDDHKVQDNYVDLENISEIDKLAQPQRITIDCLHAKITMKKEILQYGFEMLQLMTFENKNKMFVLNFG